MESGVHPGDRIDEVTFETCPLFAMSGKGWSGLVNGVLAGTGALSFATAPARIGELQQRDFFLGRFT